VKVKALRTVRVDSFPNLLFVEVETDTGHVGLGETFYGADAVESHLHAVAAPLLLGRDPREIKKVSTELVGYNGYAGTGAETRARSAVDIALWDLLGKSSGEPLYNLLGGRSRESIRIYNTCAGPGYVNGAEGQSVANWGVREGELEDLHAAINHPGRLASELLAQGITGMKIWPFDPYAEATGGHDITRAELAEALHRVEAIRSAVGLDMDVMIEMHGLWDVPAALRIVHALEEFSPYWVEDPVRSDIKGGLARIASETPTRVAAGETVAGVPAFVALFESQSVGVVTVDTTWSGGLTTARDVAMLADAFGIPIAPHDCTGPVALAACVHLCTAAPNTLLQETVRAGYLGWYSTLVEGWPEIANGAIRPLDKPGHGVSLLPDLYERRGTKVRMTDDSSR
jgi:L-alanine-DL-glutamate epimerase-like enolase superfamily enzyme